MKGELTRYAFISHIEDYLKKLLYDPIHADTDDFLHEFGIDGPVALKMLLKKSDPNDESSAILIRTEKIKDNGFDENGKRNKDTFEVSYKIPRKDFKKKLRNLYINLFESNIVTNDFQINEGAWGYGPLDNDSALDYQTEFATVAIKVLISKLENSRDTQDLWANLGVLVDFLKKYKDDEIQLTDEYNQAIDIVKSYLSDIMVDDTFASDWSEPDKFKSSIKKIYKDISLLRYQKEIMNTNPQKKDEPTSEDTLMEDGEGATNCESSSGQFVQPLFGKPLKKSLYVTQEQIDYIKESVAGETVGDYEYDVPFGRNKKKNKFYRDAMDHSHMMEKSWKGK